jgi:hypothetical protein
VRRRLDRTSLVAGLAVCGLGVLTLLDRTGVLDLRFGYALPAVLGAAGAILLTAGLEGPRDR